MMKGAVWRLGEVFCSTLKGINNAKCGPKRSAVRADAEERGYMCTK